jgi:hypothetical protein
VPPTAQFADACVHPYPSRSELTPEGRRATKLDEILLNGNNVAIMVPGGNPPYDDVVAAME